MAVQRLAELCFVLVPIGAVLLLRSHYLPDLSCAIAIARRPAPKPMKRPCTR